MVKATSSNKRDRERKLINDDMLSIVSPVSVVEYMVAQSFGMLYEQKGQTFDEIQNEHHEWLNLLMQKMLPGFDPAKSDPIASEMQSSLSELVVMIEHQFERYSKIHKPGGTQADPQPRHPDVPQSNHFGPIQPDG
jgi:hypothetical protein